MSGWLQENIIKNLTAFQLVVLILGVLAFPLVDMFKLLMSGAMALDLYIVLIFAAYCVVVVCVLAVAAIVYRKDKEAKIETAKAVEFTPSEKFTLKQAIALMQGVGGLRQTEKFVPAPEEGEICFTDLTDEEFLELMRKEAISRGMQVGKSDSGGSG